MAELFDYKCPNCGGALEFNAEAQTLKCPYCDSEIDMEALSARESELDEAAPDQLDWNDAAGQEWSQEEIDGMKVYVCKSCGGEIIADETTGATQCPFCGNPVVVKGTFSGTLKPDCVIPFKVNKKQAKEAYYKHLEGKPFLPKIFKDENHIDEIKGVYVPFWLFDADIQAMMHYDGTKVRSWSDSKNNYVETSHFSILRQGSISFENVPVDGSKNMDDVLMQSIEPYNFKELVPFKTAYLAGYMADKYDVSSEESIGIARSRIRNSAENAFRNTAKGYSSVETVRSNMQQVNGDKKYALLPVWILSTTYEGQRYIFAMNGQTGKLVGDLPADKNAYWNNFMKTGGITAAVIFVLSVIAAFVM